MKIKSLANFYWRSSGSCQRAERCEAKHSALKCFSRQLQVFFFLPFLSSGRCNPNNSSPSVASGEQVKVWLWKQPKSQRHVFKKQEIMCRPVSKHFSLEMPRSPKSLICHFRCRRKHIWSCQELKVQGGYRLHYGDKALPEASVH